MPALWVRYIHCLPTFCSIKLVEIADSERFQQGHHRGAFKLVLVQLQRTVTFIDDIDDGESRI